MDLLELMQDRQVEQIVAVNDPATGLLGFIILHDTTRGPGIGGCRLAPYANAEEALTEGVALALAMTRKCALSGLNAGGAKGVFIEHDGITDRAAMFQAVGRYIESLGGRFYTSGDLGVGPKDIALMRKTSRFVAVPDGGMLDLAGATAEGMLASMRVTLDACGLGPELKNRRVAVQGLGAMGSRLVRRLCEEGASVVAADLDPTRFDALSDLAIERVTAAEILTIEADIFSPCAVSGVLTSAVAESLSCKAVVGTANNQLGDGLADDVMAKRGILYAPDFAVNAGALVLTATHYIDHFIDAREVISRTVTRIDETVRRIFHVSKTTGDAPGLVAERLAQEALQRPRSTERQWWPVH